MRVAEKGEEPISLGERTYFIDPQGFLLDYHHHYLINQQNQKIRLSTLEIAKLREASLLS